MAAEPNWLEFFEDRERRYAGFYLNYAQDHARRDPAAYAQLEVELGNLLRAAEWFGAQSETEGILRLAEALWVESDFIRSRGFMQRGLPLLAEALQAAQLLADPEFEFRWLTALADVYWSFDNFEAAQPLYEQALSLAYNGDKLQPKAQAHLGIGRLELDMGHFEAAATSLRQALQYYRQIQDDQGEITTLIFIGNLLSLQGNFAEAEVILRQGVPAVQARQDQHNETALYYALGYTAALAENWPQAIVHFEAATQIARQIGNRYYEVRGLTALGEAHLALGHLQQAVLLLEEAAHHHETSDDTMAKAFTLVYLAKAYHARGDLTRSLMQLEQVYPYLLETSQAPVLAALAAEAAWLMADTYLKQGQIGSAQTALYDVLQLAPDHLPDMRQQAQRLLDSIESQKLKDDHLEYMRD